MYYKVHCAPAFLAIPRTKLKIKITDGVGGELGEWVGALKAVTDERNKIKRVHVAQHLEGEGEGCGKDKKKNPQRSLMF